MRVLGIESSCDETAAALVTDSGEVLADVVASQVAMHGPYGGIVPELASRAHMQAIIPVIREALAQSPGGLQGVDAIAVTQGPGLVGSLLVGVQVAKALAWSHRQAARRREPFGWPPLGSLFAQARAKIRPGKGQRCRSWDCS